MKGYIRGFDVRTGKRLWIFHTIPAPGEFGNETWVNDSWSYTGNTGVWAQISVDEELGSAYLPVEIADRRLLWRPSARQQPVRESPGRGRSEDGQAPVALPVRPPRHLGHATSRARRFSPTSPSTAARSRPWRSRPSRRSSTCSIARPASRCGRSKSGRAEGRRAGRVVFADAAVSDQAAGVRPAGRVDRRPDRLHAGAAGRSGEARRRDTRSGRIFTPPVVSKVEGPLGDADAWPSAGGGTNWPGGSFDPETQHPLRLVVEIGRASSAWCLRAIPRRTTCAYRAGQCGDRRADGPGRAGADSGAGAAAPRPAGRGRRREALTVRGLPLVKPPYGRITAIDLNKGEIVWQMPHGETPDNVRNHPALKGLNIPRTGRHGHASARSSPRRWSSPARAASARRRPASAARCCAPTTRRRGKEVGAVYMPAPQTGSPMTYMLNGRQYIVVAISGAGYSGELIAYRLAN